MSIMYRADLNDFKLWKNDAQRRSQVRLTAGMTGLVQSCEREGKVLGRASEQSIQ